MPGRSCQPGAITLSRALGLVRVHARPGRFGQPGRDLGTIAASPDTEPAFAGTHPFSFAHRLADAFGHAQPRSNRGPKPCAHGCPHAHSRPDAAPDGHAHSRTHAATQSHAHATSDRDAHPAANPNAGANPHVRAQPPREPRGTHGQ